MFKNKKEELITKIIDAEWEMFHRVPNNWRDSTMSRRPTNFRD